MRHYRFLSNITDFSHPLFIDVVVAATGDENSGVIKFKDGDKEVFPSFLTIRAHEDNHLLFKMGNYESLLYVPAGEVFSIDGIGQVSKIRLIKSFDLGNQEKTSGKLQWIAGI